VSVVLDARTLGEQAAAVQQRLHALLSPLPITIDVRFA
jgi:hypothetical protein